MKMRPAPPTTRGFIRALGVISLLAIVSAPPVAAAEPPKFNPPKTYYLALGDSFAYGFTNAKFLAGRPPSPSTRASWTCSVSSCGRSSLRSGS